MDFMQRESHLPRYPPTDLIRPVNHNTSTNLRNGTKKNIPSAKKKAMWNTYKERKKIGKSTKFICEGKEVSTQKLSRWLKDNGKVPSPTASPGDENYPLPSGQMCASSPALLGSSM
jgi:hypothetical protein